MSITVRDLKPALTTALGTMKHVADDLRALKQARITYSDGELKILATDRYIIVEHSVDYKGGDTDFTFFMDEDSLNLISKLPLLTDVEISKEGFRARNMQFAPVDDYDFPNIDHFMEDVWSLDWLEEAERGKRLHEEDMFTGFSPELVKHIKGVDVIPQPHGGDKARLQAPGVRGLMMGKRVKKEYMHV